MEFKVVLTNKPWYEKVLFIPLILFGVGMITALFVTMVVPIIFTLMMIIAIIVSFIACKYVISYSYKLLYKGLDRWKIGKSLYKTTETTL